jgi:hypothetical protein
MSFGGQTMTLVSVTREGEPGWGGLVPEVRTEVEVTDCRGRLLSVSETPENLTNVSTEVWKWTVPPVPAALEAKATDELIYEGTTFKIEGRATPKYDMDGTVHHVTIVCRRADG